MNQEEVGQHNPRSQIRALAAENLRWDEGSKGAKEALHNLGAVIDLGNLVTLAEKVHRDRSLSITFISQEYLRVGLNWIESVKRLDLQNYLIIAGDPTTYQVLKESGIVSIEARIDVRQMNMSYRSPLGFTAKGLAMNALKFPIVSTLLKRGYDLVMSDADAVWLQNPMPYFPLAVDVAFQRVVYFPQSIVKIWGFAACSGFVFFRSKDKVVSFLEDCIHEHRRVQSDQLALNLALLEADMQWPTPKAGLRADRTSNRQQEDIEVLFEEAARSPIIGHVGRYGFAALALPHHEFWRHSFVRSVPSEMIICHPNSPKNDQEKMRVLRDRDIQFFNEH